MEQKQTGTRPKLELQLNQSVVVSLMRDKAYVGENGFGAYYLYQVKDEAGTTEYSFFAPVEIHQKIVEAGVKTGDLIKLTKVAVQNGKKVSSRLDFDVVSKAATSPEPASKDNVPFDIPDDGFRNLMVKSLKDAIEATRAVNSMQWSVDDVRSIALTIFIQRARS